MQSKELKDEVVYLKQEKESILAFHETFTLLEEILKKDCNIDLKTDLGSFSKIFSDFKDNGYDIKNIVNQYKKAIKLEWDIKFSENRNQAINNQLSGLGKNVGAYQSLLYRYAQNELGFVTETRSHEIWNR